MLSVPYLFYLLRIIIFQHNPGGHRCVFLFWHKCKNQTR